MYSNKMIIYTAFCATYSCMDTLNQEKKTSKNVPKMPPKNCLVRQLTTQRMWPLVSGLSRQPFWHQTVAWAHMHSQHSVM